MEAERAALARALRVPRASIHRCGLGAAGVRQWAARGPAIADGARVVVVGVAGALEASAKLYDTHWINRIHGVRGVHELAESSTGACSCACVDVPASSEREKLALRERTGANLVDMEGEALAETAAQRGWRMRMLRSVSDDHATDLPKWLMDVLNTDGSVRLVGLLAAIPALPGSLVDLVVLSRRVRLCMARAADMLRAEGLA